MTTKKLWGLLLAAATLAVSALPSSAFAQEPFGIDAPAPGPPASEGTEQAVVGRYWSLGTPRPFVSMTLEAGYAYVQPKFEAGYGQPFWRWIGLEAYPLVSLSGVGGYAGLSAGIPGLTLRVGGRYSYPFDRYLLEPKQSYKRSDTELELGPRADYLALKAELTGTLPLGPGSAFTVLTGQRIELTDDGYYLLEESLRAVMQPPYIYRGRLGYLLSFGAGGSIRVGGAADVIALPQREEFVIRGGLLASVLVDAHMEAQASFIPVLFGPDSLGLAGGDFGQLGVRFRWATDSTPDPARVRQFRTKQQRQQPVD